MPVQHDIVSIILSEVFQAQHDLRAVAIELHEAQVERTRIQASLCASVSELFLSLLA